MATIKPLYQIWAKNAPLLRPIVNQNALGKNFTSHSMSKAWTIKKVVPNVIDDIPTYKLGVQYAVVNINEGTIVNPRQVKDQPTVSWKFKERSELFALCMVDPDAPSRSKPVQREWLHWLVVNIPGNSVEKGETLAEYIGAGPPKDTDFHRYVFLLYVYRETIKFTEKKILKTSPEGRPKFSVRKFTEKYSLGRPVAGNFFMAEYDNYVPELFKQLGLK
ncbi:protein D3-like [Anoplophora glabripennis]|uniref:protein D3-like n=1 Tax=Anoplophora glabripennis TaxID=217634 RepID=UPI00087481CA|nr:protein D3-like [Anoplophora glabripennis]